VNPLTARNWKWGSPFCTSCTLTKHNPTRLRAPQEDPLQ